MSASPRSARPPRSRPRRREPAPRGAARRDALLEAVLRVVAEVGPDAVTHRRVAEVAGLPLASTTYWFASKEHLLTAALELAARRDTDRLLADAALARRAGRPLEGQDALDAAVDMLTDPLDEGWRSARGSVIASYALLLEAARRPALQEVASRWTEAYLLTLGELLTRAGSARPREDAELIIAAIDGLLIERLATGVEVDLRARLRRLAGALVGSS